MAGKNVTRVDLAEAVREKVGLSKEESAEMVRQVIDGICETLAAGELVKLSGFGLFTVRSKAERVGRNPKTLVEVPIKPRQTITFKASHVLQAHVNGSPRKPYRG